MHSTSASLLERVQQRSDQIAWGRFVALYTPLIFYWGRKCGLQADDAADLTQDVFAALVEKLPGFTYDQHRSFRSWLRVVTLNQWRDRARRIAARPLPDNRGQLDDVVAPDNVAELEESEYRQHLVNRALQLMRTDFKPSTWQAFWEHGVLGRPAAVVAQEQGITTAAVHCARLRVLTRLRQELKGLID